jgi:hypothetical protein
MPKPDTQSVAVQLSLKSRQKTITRDTCDCPWSVLACVKSSGAGARLASGSGMGTVNLRRRVTVGHRMVGRRAARGVCVG